MARGERDESHPSASELQHFLLGEMSPHQAAPIVSHLLRGCQPCSRQMTPLTSGMFATGPLAPEAAPNVEAEYDFPLFKAFAAARRYATALGKAKVRVKGDAAQFPQDVPRLGAVTLETRPQTQNPRARLEVLLERCLSLRHSDPEAMVLSAEFAVRLAQKSGTDEEPPERLSDLRARAWGELGNAYRVANDQPAAETALAYALELSHHGTMDPLLLARLMDLTASLFIDRRRFEEAHQLLNWVYTIYTLMEDQQGSARALISKGICAGAAFESEDSVRHLEQGISQADAVRDPRLILAAVHGLLLSLLDCGRVSEVGHLLEIARGLYETQGERLDELRRSWLEGRVAAASGNAEIAERILSEVCAGFKSAELPYDAALASLDLAAVWLRQGRTVEISRLVDEMVAVFRSSNIQREALGALLMLREALQADQATATLLRNIAAQLWKLERLPKLEGHTGYQGL